MPPRINFERFERNTLALRALVDAGSPSVVRDPMVGSAMSGTRRRYPLPSIGFRSGKLTVTGYLAGTRNGVRALVVKCDCGHPEYTVDHHNFKNFKSTRCSICAKKAAARKRFWKYIEYMPDDRHRTRLLNRLGSAISRCHNPKNVSYANYGGRGIYVHETWRADRGKFLEYVQTCEGWDNAELDMDRTDNSKGYEPGNIRFASRKENAANRRVLADLEEENRSLRHRLRRAEEQVLRLERERATGSP